MSSNSNPVSGTSTPERIPEQTPRPLTPRHRQISHSIQGPYFNRVSQPRPVFQARHTVPPKSLLFPKEFIRKKPLLRQAKESCSKDLPESSIFDFRGLFSASQSEQRLCPQPRPCSRGSQLSRGCPHSWKRQSTPNWFPVAKNFVGFKSQQLAQRHLFFDQCMNYEPDQIYPACHICQTPVSPVPKNKKPFIPETGFFMKRSFINPVRIRANSVRNAIRNAPPFKVHLEFDDPNFDRYDENTPYIFRLPEKLRVKIFRYISVEERTRVIQLVCRQFHAEIRRRVGIQTSIDETTHRGLTFMRDLIVETVYVGRYLNPNMPPKHLMIHPRIVKELIFIGPIRIQHLDAFFLKCCGVKKLTFQNAIIRRLADVSLCKAEGQFGGGVEWRGMYTVYFRPTNLRCLQQLSIDFRTMKHALEALCVIFHIVYPKNLRRLAVRIGGRNQVGFTTAIHLKVLSYIKQFTKLTHLLISTHPRRVTYNRFEHLGLPRLELRDLGKDIQFRELILTEHSVNFHSWHTVILWQKKLEVFHVIHAMEWGISQLVVQLNASTLRKIGINVELWTWGNRAQARSVPLDLNAFKNCHSLQELFICVGAPVNTGDSDVINFDKLPRSIEVLLLRNCTVESSDFSKIVQQLKKLRIIGIQTNESTVQGHGVKSGTIRKLLQLRYLNELFISGYYVKDGKEGAFRSKSVTTKAFKLLVDEKDKKDVKKKKWFYIRGEDPRWTYDKQGDWKCAIRTYWSDRS